MTDLSDDSSGSATLEHLIEEFEGRLRRGDAISATDFAGQHPDHEAELLEVLGAIRFLEKNAASSTTPLASPLTGKQFGEYVLG